MLYLDYESLKKQYLLAQDTFNAILLEKEALFQMTQPKAISIEEDKVSGGMPENQFDEYLIKKERNRIDERLAEAKSLLNDREQLLSRKEKDLRASSDQEDIIYCCKILDGMKIRDISKMINYSEPQIYRILKEIRLKIER